MNNEFNQWSNSVWVLMPNWKWIGILIALAAGFLLHSLLKNFFHRLKDSHWARSRSVGFFLHFLETSLQSPVAWLVTSLFWTAALDSLSVPPVLEKYLKIAIQLLLSVNLILLAYRAIEAFGVVLTRHSSKSDSKLDNQLAPMVTKVLKIFVVVFGVLLTLQSFDVKVMSILAGLGLGGLALALAAQDTAANLFGSVMILVDKPFRVGDFIKVAGTEGVVEDIGFRSTRIRTPYNSLITIPNSVAAKETIDNLELRPQRRVRHVLGLTYDSTDQSIKAFMGELETYLRNHPSVEASSATVRMMAFGDFSIQVLVQFFILTRDWNEEMRIQQDFLFFARETAQRTQVDFAFPTSTQLVKLMDYQAVAAMGAKDLPPNHN